MPQGGYAVTAFLLLNDVNLLILFCLLKKQKAIELLKLIIKKFCRFFFQSYFHIFPLLSISLLPS